jgi:hypothetical protein
VVKIMVSAGLFSSGGTRGESVSLPFPASRGHLHSLAVGLVSLQPLLLFSHLL